MKLRKAMSVQASLEIPDFVVFELRRHHAVRFVPQKLGVASGSSLTIGTQGKVRVVVSVRSSEDGQ